MTRDRRTGPVRDGSLSRARRARRAPLPRHQAFALLFLLPLSALGCAHEDPPAATYDLLIRGGSLIDGAGGPARVTDVLVVDGRIAFVGPVDPETLAVRETFDAEGLVVAPGFIDAHAHGDPVEDGAFQNFLAQGVTTIVLGQDGASPAPGSLARHLAAVDDARPGVNVGYLVGHNTIRTESGVGFGDPGPEGLARMRDLVTLGLDAGAFGLSTGLEYDPGSRAGIEELAAIAGPVAAADGVVTSHLRSEDADRVKGSLEELIEQGRRSGARVHVAHIKVVLGRDTALADRLLQAITEAGATGVEVSADIYPYTASFTGLSILFPEWARPPADYAAVARQRRPELAAYLRDRVESRNGPGAMRFGTAPFAGRTLAEVAAERGQPYEQVLVELGPDGGSAAYFVMDDEVMRRLLLDPRVVISSDGSPSMLHPRGYGSFALVIRRFVVEERALSLEEAVRRMSGATAAIYRLDDPSVSDPPRGRVHEGWAADLVAFSPDDVRDTADFEHPHRLAAGIRSVWVNGRRAWSADGPAPGAGAGIALRARR